MAQRTGFSEGLAHAVLVRMELPIANAGIVEAGVTRDVSIASAGSMGAPTFADHPASRPRKSNCSDT